MISPPCFFPLGIPYSLSVPFFPPVSGSHNKSLPDGQVHLLAGKGCLPNQLEGEEPTRKKERKKKEKRREKGFTFTSASKTNFPTIQGPPQHRVGSAVPLLLGSAPRSHGFVPPAIPGEPLQPGTLPLAGAFWLLSVGQLPKSPSPPWALAGPCWFFVSLPSPRL